MEYCNNCIFYDKAYDDLRMRWNDTIKIEKKSEEKHFCRMYSDGIPQKIWEGNGKCQYKHVKSEK